jgi:hypothetical protein
MKKIYLIVIISSSLTGCASTGLGKTCEKFGMQTEYVDVIALDHDVDGKGFTQTKFHCVPRIKLKSGR